MDNIGAFGGTVGAVAAGGRFEEGARLLTPTAGRVGARVEAAIECGTDGGSDGGGVL
jgi:hypothetical protein